MTLVPVCLGYIMKTENVKANPKVTAGKKNSTQTTKWTGKTIHVTM